MAELTDGKGTIKGVAARHGGLQAHRRVQGGREAAPADGLRASLPDAVETKRALLLKAMLEETFGKENIEVILRPVHRRRLRRSGGAPALRPPARQLPLRLRGSRAPSSAAW
ncbi:MAG: hypothetical protein MZV65_15900 [Chromatiales bacterium]|nr:hypothetical protein [Chromatiales bacterium]